MMWTTGTIPKPVRLYMIFLKTAFETNFGWVGIELSNCRVSRSTLPHETKKDCSDEIALWTSTESFQAHTFHPLIEKIKRYLSGHNENLTKIPIDTKNTSPFFKAAWNVCRTIPKGQTRSYKWLAINAGSPNAVRAAGQAMAKNKLPLLVPCHRIIGHNGSLTGFGRGAKQLTLKQNLLKLERVNLL